MPMAVPCMAQPKLDMSQKKSLCAPDQWPVSDRLLVNMLPRSDHVIASYVVMQL